jgi:L-asparaginase/Glu-tRNA(Gln) amidotransferase subunit D
MKKPTILVITGGGTFCYKRNEKGIYLPSGDSYIDQVEGLDKIANIIHVDLGAVDSSEIDTVALDEDYDRSIRLQKLMVNRREVVQTILDHPNVDGVAFFQGSDTASPSAAAVHYMLQNYRKPIVIGTTQNSIWEPGSPAKHIIRSAIKIATEDIGETVLTDGHYVIRGVRARKVSSTGYPIFMSFTYPPLGKVEGEEINLFEHHLRRDESKTPTVFEGLDTRVDSFKQISGQTTPKGFDAALNLESKALLMEAWGLGTLSKIISSNPGIERCLNDKPIAVVSECLNGGLDLGVYSQGSDLSRLGFIDCGDLTWDAASQKLFYALGKAYDININSDKPKIDSGKDFIDFIREIMRTPISGDMTPNVEDRCELMDIWDLYSPKNKKV